MSHAFKLLKTLALNPWMILGSLAAGVLLGLNFPALSLRLAFVGQIYLELMMMVVLPFMMSAVIFSVQRLIKEGGAGPILGRLVLVFAAFALVAALIGAGVMQVLHADTEHSQEALTTFGTLVGAHAETHTEMALKGADPQPDTLGLTDLLASLVPSNIFEALAKGNTLQILVFSLLLGMAVGRIPSEISHSLTEALETLFQSCQQLMRWLTYLLPLVLLCMTAGQIAKTGLKPMLAMMQFIMVLALASTLILALSGWILWFRSGKSLGETVRALRDPFALAVATRNSVICMPSMIESLTRMLGFRGTEVELLVPLCVSMLRPGTILFYVCTTLFIADFYDHPLDMGEMGLVMAVSIMAGFASAGMNGVATVTLVGIVCGYLNLPFEAAVALFLAIDPISDTFRTLVNVISNLASLSLICPRPRPEEAIASAITHANSHSTLADGASSSSRS